MRIFLTLALSLAVAIAQPVRSDTVIVLSVDDAIGPATADYLSRGLERAAERGAQLVVIQLNTPGGLDSAMRSIIQDIIASTVPVAVFVAPSGARAASAGTYILYSAHVAAMAPATNLGAATPVQIGGIPDLTPSEPPRDRDKGEKKEKKDEKETEGKEKTDVPHDAMSKKMVNDAVAYIRSLAQMRGRNAEWAESAVRDAASLSAEEALEKKVIDVIAGNVNSLLDEINGRKVTAAGVEKTLETKDAMIEIIEPDWRSRLLAVITDPNVAYILMLLGIYGLFFELANPGFVLPGVIGAISLLLALYAFQVLPVNYAGLGLMLLGIAFMVGEAFMPSFGALGIGGVIAFVIGSLILFETDGDGISVSLPLIGSFALASAAVFLGIMGMALRIHRRPVVSGREEMVGSIGTALDGFDSSGLVHIHGERWKALTYTPVKRGDPVRVVAIDGLILVVEPTARGTAAVATERRQHDK